MSSQAHSTAASAAPLFPTSLVERLRFDLETREWAGQQTPTEGLWAQRGLWLKAAGYTLRSQRRRERASSWRYNGANRFNGYIGYGSSKERVFDAIRTSDGTLVSLKLVDSSDESDELAIGRYFSSEDRRSDPRNHCMPILDVVQPPDTDTEAIMVMPILTPFQKPHFLTVGECVAFFTQIFEGMQFMHRHNVAHRNYARSNIMMDASPLYRACEHPAEKGLHRAEQGEESLFTRTERPVKYYFVDFSLSCQYNPEDGPPRELPILGRDQSAPEHDRAHWNVPCDPFPTDVYFLGNLIREEFMNKSRKFCFMETLVADMTQRDPARRPTMDEAVERFRRIRQSLGWWRLRLRVNLRPRHCTFWEWMSEWWKIAGFVYRRLSAIPDVDVRSSDVVRPHRTPFSWFALPRVPLPRYFPYAFM